MIQGAVYDSDDNCLLPDVHKTTNAWDRMRGLLGRSPLTAQQGLLIESCASVHTLFMSQVIDLVYLDNESRIRKLVNDLVPWRFSSCLGATKTLELGQGQIEQLGLRKGMSIYWRASANETI